MYITRADKVFPVFRNLTGKNRMVLKARDLILQFFHFFLIKGIGQSPASKDQMDVPVGDMMIQYMMDHGAEGRDACSGAHQKKIFFNRLGQGKESERPPERKFAAQLYFIK